MKNQAASLLTDYGMVIVLLLLCVFYSYLTWDEQHPVGASGGRGLAHDIAKQFPPNSRIAAVVRVTQEDTAFAQALTEELERAQITIVKVIQGSPLEARRALEALAEAGEPLQAIAASPATADWAIFDQMSQHLPALGQPALMSPRSYWWPNFLKANNLLNIANQISVIAVIAIGMTMVIITAGIDLSVGSLIALSAVTATLLIREVGGAEAAGVWSMIICCLGGILVCAGMGLLSGVMVAVCAIPPFIVTLGMMLVASGLAYLLAEGQSIYQVPDTFVWLGRGTDLFNVPNAVVLMLLLYAAAHVVMTRMSLGRYIYAVGGNPEAARLSGVRVKRILVLVYTVSGALAGLGGIIMASLLKSGSPTYGLVYELYVIAAVVVGGTSLAGGEGKILGTLIGAFIIAVIQNGMNLTNVEPYKQKVVLGLVILGAVLLDRIKRKWWKAGPAQPAVP